MFKNIDKQNKDAESRFFSILDDEPMNENGILDNIKVGASVVAAGAKDAWKNIREGAGIIAKDLRVNANVAKKNIAAGAGALKVDISSESRNVKASVNGRIAAIAAKAEAEEAEKDRRKSSIALAAELEITRTSLKFTLMLIFITAVAFAYITSAWFASNHNNSGEGMSVLVTTSKNLVISATATDIMSTAMEQTNPTTVVFNDDAIKMKPARHFLASETSYTLVSSTDTGLIYNTNPSKVDLSNGFEAGETALTFEAVPVYQDGQKRFYVDYTVYIASTIEAMDVSALNVEISAEHPGLSATPDYIQAASVDFYVGSVATANYRGTLNVVGKEFENTGTARTSIDLTGSATSYTIPHNTEGYITVVMRFYFDGGLEKSEDQAYVYTEGLTTADFDMTVSFSAVEI